MADAHLIWFSDAQFIYILFLGILMLTKNGSLIDNCPPLLENIVPKFSFVNVHNHMPVCVDQVLLLLGFSVHFAEPQANVTAH